MYMPKIFPRFSHKIKLEKHFASEITNNLPHISK